MLALNKKIEEIKMQNIFNLFKKNNTERFAELEFDVLTKTGDLEDRPLVEEFRNEIIALVRKFGNSGQSGGSATYVAAAIADTVKKLCMQQPISPVSGIDEEWMDVAESMGGEKIYQNRRCGALFKKDRSIYYLDAIVWQGEDKYDTFCGTQEGICSRQCIKGFPFTPKTFYVDVKRELYNIEKHGPNADTTSCGDGDYVYSIKDYSQLNKVFEYYEASEEFSKPFFKDPTERTAQT